MPLGQLDAPAVDADVVARRIGFRSELADGRRRSRSRGRRASAAPTRAATRCRPATGSSADVPRRCLLSRLEHDVTARSAIVVTVPCLRSQLCC